MPERVLGEPIKSKKVTTMKELEEALTKALGTHSECEGIRVQKITLLAEPGGVAKLGRRVRSRSRGGTPRQNNGA